MNMFLNLWIFVVFTSAIVFQFATSKPKPVGTLGGVAMTMRDSKYTKKTEGPFPLLVSKDVDLDVCKAQRRVQKRKNNNESREKRALTVGKAERLWEFGVIPYEIDPSFSGSQRALFKQAMRHWQNSTCLTFVERTEGDHLNYIVFTEKPCGCCSFVGKRGNGPQGLSIGKGCDRLGTVIHELGHAIGFWHEHARPDRDDHVAIITENIMTGQEFNFNKLTPHEIASSNTTFLDGPYDFGSIMHYARNTFSRNQYLDTILPKENQDQNNSSHRRQAMDIGQRKGLSPEDIVQANKLYKCPACGQTLMEPKGIISSPNYFSDKNNQTTTKSRILKEFTAQYCQWRIVATHGEKIVLNITDLDMPRSGGHLETPLGTQNLVKCSDDDDYLEVRDGYWKQAPLLARFCGSSSIFYSSTSLISTGAWMLLTFSTSEVNKERKTHHQGFTANYEAICGGELRADSGHLESPNFPEDYLPLKNCLWKIIVPEGYQVALTFHSFDIENHSNCTYDFLEIHDTDPIGMNETFMGRYCGQKIGSLSEQQSPILSKGNQMWIRFVSDGSVERGGFSASFVKEIDECAGDKHDCQHSCRNTIGGYECACKFGFALNSNGKECENVCGGLIEIEESLGEKVGQLTSPSFPNLYPGDQNCVWEIRATNPHTRIVLNFTHLDIEGSKDDCDYDSVEVSSIYSSSKLSQGQLDNSDSIEGLNRLGWFCGSSLPPSMLMSEKNSMRIVFRSDDNLEKSGFSLNYFIDQDECATNNGGCAQVCQNTVGSFMCSCPDGWMVDPGNKKICRRLDNQGSSSSTDALMKRQKVDEQPECTFEIQVPLKGQGIIQSPHWSEEDDEKLYSGNQNCSWVIRVPREGHRAKILFDELDLEYQEGCDYDAIWVYDGSSSDSLLLGKFCGSKLLQYPLVASSNVLFLHFTSDESVNGRGFHGRVSSVCGGLLFATEEDNYLYSHVGHGDMTYPEMSDCEWTLESDSDDSLDTISMIELTFIKFEIEDDQNCSCDFVEIFSDSDTQEEAIEDEKAVPSLTSLGRYCGNRPPPPFYSSGSIIVQFRSDDTVGAKGFLARYRLVVPEEEGFDKIIEH